MERYIYLVKQGAVRVFRLTSLEEQTIRFGYTGSIINSLASFVSDKPSDLYIEALRKTEVYKLGKNKFLDFVKSDPKHILEYNQLLEMLLVQQLEREIDLLTASPIERYQRVLERSPMLFQEIPLKYIASYLRMTPETLSRIRGNG